MKNAIGCLFAIGLIGLVGCESTQKPVAAPSNVMDASSLDSLRVSLGSDVKLAGVDRVLSDQDFLAIEHAETTDFPVGTPVAIIDSNKVTLAHGSVVAIAGSEVQVQFTTTGPRRPQVGDAAIPFPKK